MKILHFNEHYGNLGGAERYVKEVCGALLERGWEPVVVASSADAGGIAEQGVRIHRLPPSFGLRSSWGAAGPLKQILDAERPDVVHLHNVQYLLGPPLIRVIQGQAPVVQTVHDARAFCPRWTSKIIPSPPALCTYPMGAHCLRHGCYPYHRDTRAPAANFGKFLQVGWQLRLMRSLYRILISSRYMCEQLLLNGFDAGRITLLPMFPSIFHLPLAPNARQRRIVFAGRVDESKGIREFLLSIAGLPPGNWSALVAGNGPCLAEAKSLAAELGLGDKITFAGWLDDHALAQTIASACALVISTRVPESFGLVGLEALACGTPVVAFDAGGISEWLADGQTGFRVPWGDVKALTRRLAQLLDDPELVETLGRQGRERAACFAKAAHVDRLCAIYSEAAASRHGA
jgi:glycosyltransferase involved in cell wall biosynthesis